MEEIFKYIDRIFAMIRPRRLLYLAIDGVAPRAKMNQQRSRRFRAAQEAREKQERACELRKELIERGEEDETDEPEGTTAGFDSNCITPGTPFMDLVARSLRYYILSKINSDPAWQQISIILSDASVPGEGEHKIVDYIRKQRLEPNYDPNQQNVIYGLDADLIMLSMATHESRFHVLREDVFAEDKLRNSNCYSCGKPGHIADKCPGRGNPSEKDNESQTASFAVPAQKPFIFLQVTILREYLEAELKPQRPVPFDFNLERAIDDWIFLCFFVGNDFLPHLPSLELREGAIDILLKIYKEIQGRLGGYICDGGKVNLQRAQMVMEELAKVEPTIFEKRQLKEERRLENIQRRKAAELEEQESLKSSENSSKRTRYDLPSSSAKIEIVTPQSSGQSNHDIIEQQRIMRERNIEAARALKANLLTEEASSVNASTSSINTSTSSLAVIDDPEAPVDIVKLWEPGARERYYVSKFNIKPEEVDEFAKKVARSYVEGFCWVLAYYYRGCPSWKWFYPFHYAPFAADLCEISNLEIEFEQGEPFRPFDQLMAVFPAASREHIPPAFHNLMTNHDSEIIDFYPEDFLIDMNGKKAAWQGVALLPFIEEIRLLKALEKFYPNLTEIEKKRNKRGNDVIFTYKESKLGKWLQSADILEQGDTVEIPLNIMPPGAQVGTPDPDNHVELGKTFFSHISSLPDVKNEFALSAKLLLHSHALDDYNFNLLDGVVPPERQLNESDIYMTRTGASAQSFPNILTYGNYGGNRNKHHSMHRDTRDQMRRADGGAATNYRNSYNNISNSNNYRQNDQRRSYNYQDERGYDRFAEYGSSNVSGPYDIPSTNNTYNTDYNSTNNRNTYNSNSYSNPRQYNNRYNRR